MANQLPTLILSTVKVNAELISVSSKLTDKIVHFAHFTNAWYY